MQHLLSRKKFLKVLYTACKPLQTCVRDLDHILYRRSISPDDAANIDEWSQRQQYVASLQDQHKQCATQAVVLSRGGCSIGIVAARVDPSRGGAVIEVIHVMPGARGLRLSEHLWRLLRGMLTPAFDLSKRPSARRCTLMASCEAAARAAHFWITRCGWSGSPEAHAAAERHMSGTSSASAVIVDPNGYQMFIEL